MNTKSFKLHSENTFLFTDSLIYKIFALISLDAFYFIFSTFDFVWVYFDIYIYFFFIFFVLCIHFFFIIINLISQIVDLKTVSSYICLLLFSFFLFAPFEFQTTSIFYYNFSFFDFLSFDEFSYALALLTTFLYAIIFTYYVFNVFSSFSFTIFLIFSFYILFFTFFVSRFFHFYLFFEIILIPFFFLVSVWGSNIRRIWAGERLLFFTLFFSIPFFLFLINSFFIKQTFFIFSFFFSYGYYVFSSIEIFFFLFSVLFFLGVKVPLFPTHIWLPEAHGEAPTLGSIILAGLLLKLGAYGFYRFLTFFSNDFYSKIFFLFSYFLCLFSLFVSLFSIFFQLDFKKTIAYFSIGHIAYVILGFISFSHEGLLGSFIITLSHGLSATCLFFLVGFLYAQTHTRSLNFYSQLAQKIPLFSFFFFLSSLANISLPGTAGFVGEQIVLFSLSILGFEFLFLPVFFTILSGFTGMLFCFKLLFGTKVRTFSFFDLSFNDFCVSLLLIFPVFFIGFFPSLFF
jgi:NADH-quinone oxidoreductase subunit M